MSYTFPKKNKLKSRTQLQAVFSNGRRVHAGAVRCVYLATSAESLVQCGVGASSRNFKHAADRNRVKRLLREAYRMQQAPLQQYAQANDLFISLFFLYQAKELPDFESVKVAVGSIIHKIIHPGIK